MNNENKELYNLLDNKTSLIIKDEIKYIYVVQLDAKIFVPCKENNYTFNVLYNNTIKALDTKIEVLNFIEDKWEDRCGVLLDSENRVDAYMDLLLVSMNNKFNINASVKDSINKRLKAVKGELIDILYEHTVENL